MRPAMTCRAEACHTASRISAALLAMAIVAMPNALGQSDSEDTGAEVEVVVDALASPGGIALRPGGGRSGPDMFIAETGAGRVVAVSTTDETMGVVEVITGLTFAAADGALGPTCLVFRSRNTLLVGIPARSGAPAELREYEVDDEKLPLKADSHTSAIVSPGEGAGGALVGVDRNDEAVFVTTGGSHWLLRAKLFTGQATDLVQFVDTQSAGDAGSPRGVVVSEKGYVVVSQTGAENDGESLIVFYHPSDRDAGPLLSLTTGLEEIVALAYSPTTGNLYAANAVGSDTRPAGIYRIDAAQHRRARQPGCKAVLIAEIEAPTAMTFSQEGVLYVTTQGGDNEASEPAGRLLKVVGEL